jgi:hypothetical protein
MESMIFIRVQRSNQDESIDPIGNKISHEKITALTKGKSNFLFKKAPRNFLFESYWNFSYNIGLAFLEEVSRVI